MSHTENATKLMDYKEIKQNSVKKKLTQQDLSLKNTKMPSNLFWPCNKKRETKTSYENWKDQKKTAVEDSERRRLNQV